MLGYIISDKNKINVEEHEIKTFDILHKTDLNIFVIENNKVLYKNDIIFNASKNGHVQVLEWLKNSDYEFNYDNNAIEHASFNGHVEVLEWFKNYGYNFKYYLRAFNGYYLNDIIFNASKNGHVQVLEWFKNSGHELKYDKLAINEASFNGHVQVLEWFKNSGYEFKYYACAIKTKFINILKFYCNNIDIKKVIKWSNKIIFIKTIKFKTRYKYLKGYQKN